jgi:RND superfamily putative drug exporter
MTRRPWRYLIGATALLVVLAIPAFSLTLGYVDAGSEPESTTHRRAYDLISEGYGPGFNGPLTLVVDLTQTDNPEQAIASITEEALADPGIPAAAPPIPSPEGDTVLIAAIPTTAPSDFDTAATVQRLRESIDEDYVYVAGATPALIDLADHIGAALPRFIGAVLVMSFVLLMIVFRSVLVPLKAVIMNMPAIAAAWGVMVAVFQWGWGLPVIGLSDPIPIISFVPIMLFAILFGLSMDYEVFLLSRIREEWIRTGDSHESVAMGLAGTGRVITSAAAIMIAVFLAFVITPAPIFKMIGLALAAAVLIDATIIRMVVVPSAMALMGRANWWLPKWLDRILPTIHMEAEEPVVSVQSQVTGSEEPSSMLV